ncbi:TetR family transcriptional regulator [Hespellia stercorisuis]|uniref:Transcriptional regulator, TetR family n=1 Tax=Hespellia stercorisuis DSM 15480 TaxID=1121950 RepID=A0A1M6Q3M3_9FIRM|nr:transcriptional regulator, TetR family [Hespellia stercorisuis DSM 15480]
MSNNLITKDALASALKSLLQTQPLSKISVKSITTYCNISRNTFYYHFKDKYELINWIFYSDMLTNVNSFADPAKLVDSFSNVCKCLYENRRFYLACFQYVGQNSLYDSVEE